MTVGESVTAKTGQRDAQDPRSKESRIGFIALALFMIPALALCGLVAWSILDWVISLSLLDAGYYLCLVVGFFIVLSIAEKLNNLRSELRELNDKVAWASANAAGRDFLVESE